ncbi:MAG: peptidoglycan-binding protein [Clostridiaceae bacterium]|nr:peptidoglycan-binding protein [Clostridiaceae bacterium]
MMNYVWKKIEGCLIKYTGLWSFDELDSTCTDFLTNRRSDINSQESLNTSSDFIKSVQHDLQRVSCLASGEANATGVLDSKTKAAIRQFRSIVELLDSESIDSQLTNALNAITKMPTIGKGWPNNPIATKFIQWWFGAPKTGTFDDATEKMVKSWQKAARVYWEPDGVIRIESWIKILK